MVTSKPVRVVRRKNRAKSGQGAGYPWSRERVLGKLLKENNSYGEGREAVLIGGIEQESDGLNRGSRKMVD